jgi:hypothetical protein
MTMNMNVSEMNEVVESIRAKLFQGEDLKPEELEQLQPFLNVVSSCEDQGCSAASAIPYLNRFMLNDTMAITTPGPQLVRYVGMVQDMLDPEYYVIRDDKGRSTHFRDYNYLEETTCSNAEERTMTEKTAVIPPKHQYSSGNGEHPHHELAERIPLVIVPIPFATDWFRQSIQPRSENNLDNVAGVSSPKSVVNPPRKRARDSTERKGDDDNNTNNGMDRTVEHTKQLKSDDPEAGRTSAESTSNHTIDNNTIHDWWPAGSCGTSHEDCPILAKFSYDQLFPFQQEIESPPLLSRSRRRLLLNDLVSVVGVLSMNPWEADFPQQGNDQNLWCSMNEWMEAGGGGDAFTTILPPPSRLPRLHVLRYQVLDLDDMVTDPFFSSSLASSSQGQNASDDKSAASYVHLYCPNVLLRHFCGLNSSKKLAHLLWLCLLSKADRKITTTNKRCEMIHVGPMERAMGCLSVQVSMPDLNSSRAFFQHLAKNVLPQLCPVVATIDCSRKEDLRQLGLGPSKDSNGRLRPCPLQLPAGSVLLIHYHPTLQEHKDNAIKAVMNELVQHHRLSYRFEGGVFLQFEADYQIIIVSTQTQQFPCTVSILSNGLSKGAEVPPADMIMSRKTLGRARRSFKRDGSTCQVTLSSSLTERAQDDFLSRRRSIHVSNQHQESKRLCPDTAESLLPGEDDFHRWLNTTKLLAKSRICLSPIDENQKWEANERDWEVALELDDAIH